MHISDDILEKYYLNSNLLDSTTIDYINNHLAECERCTEHFGIITSINKNIETDYNAGPLPIDDLVAARILKKRDKKENQKLLTTNDSIQIFDGKVEIVKRPNLVSIPGIIYLFRNFPIQTSSFALVAALAIGFLYVTIVGPKKDLNPVSLSIENSILSTYNSNGELLWKKNIDGVPDYSLDSLKRWVFNQKRFLNLLDIDGDGKNELLISGKYVDKGVFRVDSLYCFNYNGSLRWVVSPESPKYNYAPSWKRTHWEVSEFFTIKTTSGPKLFVYANVASFGGTVISNLNPSDGSVLSTIFHSGYSTSQFHFDLDNDGNDEIIMGGTSSFNRPFLLILKTDYLMGVLPDFYTKKEFLKANALYYILFPVSDLGKLLSTTGGSNVNNIYKFNKHGIAVLINDVAWDKQEQVALQYTFDSTLTCKTVTGGSAYPIFYNRYSKQLKTPLNLQYEKLKDSILYWDGDQFQNHPMKNKYWNQPFKHP